MATAPLVDEPPPSARDNVRSEAVVAIRNGLTLGGSLLGTWTVALVVRILVPRWLGPESYGALSLAESFTATCFVLLGLGIDTYIQKELAVRPELASDFFGGVVVLRVALTFVLLSAMALVMGLAHRSHETQRLILLFGVGQLLVSINTSLAALLQAARTVGGLAIVNITAKIAWGGGVILALVARVGLEGLAVAFICAELLRLLLVARLARDRLGLRVRVDPRAVKAALSSSLPYYCNVVALTIYSRVDVTMLSMLSSDREVGWYGAAANFASLSLMVSPLVGWVVLPMLSRAAARSEDEMFAIIRRAFEGVLLVVMSTALFLGIGADVWIVAVFGRAFTPAVGTLRLLAPTFVFTYLAMLCATCLLLLRRAWTVTFISLVGLAVHPLLDLLIVRRSASAFGVGGAGHGAAAAVLVTEGLVATAMLISIGARAFDRRAIRTISRVTLSCLAVIAIDLVLRGLGPIRLVVDVFALIACLLWFGALRLGEILPLARLVLRRRRTQSVAAVVIAGGEPTRVATRRSHVTPS